jgi:ferredoxin
VSGDPADRGAELVTMAIDDSICVGGGQCEMLAEGVFEVDDGGVGRVIGPGRLARAEALEIVDRCPSGAVVIVDDPT